MQGAPLGEVQAKTVAALERLAIIRLCSAYPVVRGLAVSLLLVVRYTTQAGAGLGQRMLE
jgi:hypothetical protein